MFKFKGISSDEMKIIVEEEDKLIGKTSHKYESIEKYGSYGNNYIESGLNDKEINLKIYILDNNKLDDIFNWLDGEGTLEFKGRVTKARFYSDLSPERSSAIKIADITLIRGPLWYKADDDFIKIENNVINNIGNFKSSPLVKLVKKTSSTVTIKINDIIFSYNFPENEDYMILNTINGNAYYEDLLRNECIEIGFDYPEINPGKNNVSLISGDCEIFIKNKDCWL